jgi:hypothetical protein
MEQIPHAALFAAPHPASTAAHVALAATVNAAQEHGAGPLLRIVLVVLLVGAALMAWFLLRGYRGAGDPDDGGEQDQVGDARGGEARSGEHHAEDRRGPSSRS